MKRIQKRLRIGLAGLALMLVLLVPIGSAQAKASGTNNWKLCGTFHLSRSVDVNLEAKHYSCLQSLEVVAQMIVEPGLNECGDGCEVKGFKCHSPGAIKGGIGGAGNGFICVKGAARIRLKGVTTRH